MRKIILLIILGIFLISGCVNETQIEKNSMNEFICNQDSDCVIKDNKINCVQAFQKDDLTEPEVLIPPSHTECPDSENVVAYCDNDVCKVKYDCSKCDILKEKFEDFCPTHMSGTSGWICRMYYECNC